MKSLTMEQVVKIAKEKGLVLSYKAENGTRKRYTKTEIISQIEALEVVVEVAETVTVEEKASRTITSPVTIVAPTPVVTNNNIKLTRKVSEEVPASDADEVRRISVDELLTFVKSQLQEVESKRELQTLKTTLLSHLKTMTQTSKRSVKSKWQKKYNMVHMLLQQFELSAKLV